MLREEHVGETQEDFWASVHLVKIHCVYYEIIKE